MSYRESFNLKPAPSGSKVYIEHDAGIDFYVVWIDCPDKENILEGWLKKKQDAINYCKQNNYKIVEKP